jgi:hypothetical protein
MLFASQQFLTWIHKNYMNMFFNLSAVLYMCCLPSIPAIVSVSLIQLLGQLHRTMKSSSDLLYLVERMTHSTRTKLILD